jgi:hypothetical protein
MKELARSPRNTVSVSKTNWFVLLKVIIHVHCESDMKHTVKYTGQRA